MQEKTALNKQAKESIIEQMQEKGEITVDEVMDLVRPHFMFDSITAREQAIRRKANRLMASVKGADGTRTCFATTKTAHTYVNVENTNNIGHLKDIEKQLKKKYAGLNSSIKKVRIRIQEIGGQVSFDELEEVNS